jgi:glycosyltransferase involved in cell wall biosynthesis
MKKKILFLSPLPPPHYGSAMSSKMCLDILRSSKEVEVDNIKLNYSKKMSDVGRINFSKILGIRKVKKDILDKISNEKYDLVYMVPATSGLGFLRDSYFAKILNKKYNGHILYHLRSRVLEKTWNNKVMKALYNKIFPGNKAIVLDKNLEKDLHKLISKKNTFILPNAIENTLSERSFRNVMLSRKKRDKFNILFLSNMDETKGWKKLLYSCKLLNDEKVNFVCNFVGAWKSEKDKKWFHKFVEKNNLEKKAFSLGKRVGKEKEKILEKSDLLVFPTEYPLETFGRVIIEGMMYGLPVIANGIASIPTTIQDGETGIVLRENSPETIKEAIVKLKDKKLREKMGIKGRKRFLKEYQLDIYKKRFLKILKAA